MAFFAASCASAPTVSSAGGDWSSEASGGAVVARATIDRHSRVATADVPGLGLRRYSVGEATVSRVLIGGFDDPAVARHEKQPARADGYDKLLNDLSARPAQNIPLNVQNQLLGGGWTQSDGGYFHQPSGFYCPYEIEMVFTDDGGNQPTVTRLTAPINNIRVFDEAGRDTGCDYVNEKDGVYITMFASEWPDKTLQEHFSAALKHITDRFSVASEATLVKPEITIDGGEGGWTSTIEGETLSGAFLLEPKDGVTLKTALWLNKTGDWHVKARATYVAAKDGNTPQSYMAAELMAIVYFTATLYGIDYYLNSGGLTQVGY